MPVDVEPVRVAIVNDYEVIVKGLRTMLAEFPAIDVVEINWEDTPEASVDIALFDTFASPRSSLERIEALADDDAISKIVLYAWDLNQEFTTAALTRPVHSVISKTETGQELVDKLIRIARGEQIAFEAAGDLGPVGELSDREREVIALIASGESNRAIADELFLSVDTVKTHVRHAFRKLNVHNRTQAAVLARGLGLVRVAHPGH